VIFGEWCSCHHVPFGIGETPAGRPSKAARTSRTKAGSFDGSTPDPGKYAFSTSAVSASLTDQRHFSETIEERIMRALTKAEMGMVSTGGTTVSSVVVTATDVQDIGYTGGGGQPSHFVSTSNSISPNSPNLHFTSTLALKSQYTTTPTTLEKDLLANPIIAAAMKMAIQNSDFGDTDPYNQKEQGFQAFMDHPAIS
jgi:hypothetical protein